MLAWASASLLQTNRLPAFCDGAVEIAFARSAEPMLTCAPREWDRTDRLPVLDIDPSRSPLISGKTLFIVSLRCAAQTESLRYSPMALRSFLAISASLGHVRSASIRCEGTDEHSRERQSYYANFRKAP